MTPPGERIYHITFCPKYRHAILKPAVRRVVFAHMRHIAELKNIEIVALATDEDRPDHVHLLCSIPANMSVAKAIQLLKWYSSCHTRRELPELNETHSAKALWQKRYFATTVGRNSSRVKKYIALQERQQ